MKKFFLFLSSLLFLCFLALFFVQFKSKEVVSETGIWRLEKIEEFKIMSIKQDSSSFSEAQSALFLKKLRYESLPVSALFCFTNSSSLGNPKEIVCRIAYKNIEIEKTIGELNISPENSLYKSSGIFSFNLSELNKNRTEQEILEFIKVFPQDTQIKYSIKPVYSDHLEEQEWIDL